MFVCGNNVTVYNPMLTVYVNFEHANILPIFIIDHILNISWNFPNP